MLLSAVVVAASAVACLPWFGLVVLLLASFVGDAGGGATSGCSARVAAFRLAAELAGGTVFLYIFAVLLAALHTCFSCVWLCLCTLRACFFWLLLCCLLPAVLLACMVLAAVFVLLRVCAVLCVPVL